MSDQDPVRGIVVGHSDLAIALIRAVERIVGNENGALVPLSNEGIGPDEIRRRLDELVGEGPAIVFADLREGSCGLAARRACVQGRGRAVITGVNLPVLLDFVMNRDLPLEVLLARLVDRGRAAIEGVPGKS